MNSSISSSSTDPESPVVLFDVAPLRAAVAAGRVLLTPNRRLASRIRAALVADVKQQQPASTAPVSAMPTPPVQALSDWLGEQWRELVWRGVPAADCWVLNAEQERLLWEHCIRASDLGATLLRPAQTAELAASALRNLVLWRQWPLAAGQRGYFSDLDTASFLDWLGLFEQRCAALNCITEAERDRRVVAQFEADELLDIPAITLVCFDDLPPLHAQLFTKLRAETADIPERTSTALTLACDGFEPQIRAAARWIGAQLASGSPGPFALVVPDLGAQRQRVERILLDEWVPDHLLPGSPRQLPPVNFSAGTPLAAVPVVQSALRLLSLLLPEVARADVLALLGSPFHSLDASQTEAAAAAIAATCDLQVESISGGQLRLLTAAIAERFGGWPFDHALQQVTDLTRRQKLTSTRLPLADWAEIFHSVLDTLGWPGTRTLDSLEFQQVSQWQELLGGLAALDNVNTAQSMPTTLSMALSAVRQLAQARVFQPKTADAAVQVLGLLEASGLQFEGLWLCDMADDQWPPPASPHPLLPRDWQRRLRMPHCDAEREFSVARQLTQSLRANTRQLIVSYQRERDDVERRVSPLFDDLPSTDLAALGIDLGNVFKPAAAVSMSIQLNRFEPGAAPPLDVSVRARGGSALLADQAACPFRAFARHRLHAEPLADVQVGLSASERGTLLHAALQSLWSHLHDSATLQRCDSAELAQRASAAAEQAIAHWPDAVRLGARFLALETQRLTRLLQRWLTLEQERAEFQIAALEDEKQFRFAGLELRLRVDRIDRLPDGRVAIVDYKSGQNNSANAWLGERPEQPQLPLYALALEHEQPGQVAGVLFAQVRLDAPRWVGGGAEDMEAHAITPLRAEGVTDWPQQIQAWTTALENLANEFIQGRADVEPLSNKSCTYCALPSVCRIAHSQLELTEAEDEQ